MVFAQGAPGTAIAVPGLLQCERAGREVILSVQDYAIHHEQVTKILRTYEPDDIRVEDLNLEEIFIELSGGQTAREAMTEEEVNV